MAIFLKRSGTDAVDGLYFSERILMNVSALCLKDAVESGLWNAQKGTIHQLALVPNVGFGMPTPPRRTQDRETALQLAIRNQLPLVVDAICTRGADMSVPDEKGNPPLWLALANNLEDIASTLVRKTQPLFTHGDILCQIWIWCLHSSHKEQEMCQVTN